MSIIIINNNMLYYKAPVEIIVCNQICLPNKNKIIFINNQSDYDNGTQTIII